MPEYNQRPELVAWALVNELKTFKHKKTINRSGLWARDEGLLIKVATKDLVKEGTSKLF